MPGNPISVSRPLDVLRKSIDRNVMVDMKGRRGYSGVLEGYDVYMNLVLKSANEIVDGENKGFFSRILVRGDNVIFVSPSKGEKQ